ncbi:MAG: sulfate adenylyltransferase subunit CysD [Legionella sp.]|nr:sulfate adenylyltransferase subunit CysD [Legionella sp.]
MNTVNLGHIKQLEDESIYILREAVAQAENPALLYSIGKDSSVLLHLAFKAFYPSKIPFPLIHVDTTWKFREMVLFRDRLIKHYGLKLIVHTNQEGVNERISPFTHSSSHYTDIMKTTALRQVLALYEIDMAIGGARRDEEKSRAKERVFSLRNHSHHWNPKDQRPELWQLYHLKKHKNESFRVFPLSNWTELDIWRYIYQENIDIVPLYFAAPRPIVKRDGMLLMVDDERFILHDNETIEMQRVRFRTLGCYPLTGAIESEADTLPAIIREISQTTFSERQGRLIDFDSTASMEKKKQEGYF